MRPAFPRRLSPCQPGSWDWGGASRAGLEAVRSVMGEACLFEWPPIARLPGVLQPGVGRTGAFPSSQTNGAGGFPAPPVRRRWRDSRVAGTGSPKAPEQVLGKCQRAERRAPAPLEGTSRRLARIRVSAGRVAFSRCAPARRHFLKRIGPARERSLPRRAQILPRTLSGGFLVGV